MADKDRDPKGKNSKTRSVPRATATAKRPAKRAVVGRRQGRPSVADGGIGRQKLLDVARELLRTIPPAKLTAGDVARAAGGDRTLVRYYFGDLSSLLGEVAEQLSRGLVAHLAAASAGTDGAIARLRRHIREFVRYELENPALHPLYTEQILSGKARSARKTMIAVAGEGHAALRRIVEDGRRDGEIRSDFDIRLLDVAIIGLSEFIVIGRPILEVLIARSEDITTLIEAYGDFVADLVVNGIAAPTRTGSRGR